VGERIGEGENDVRKRAGKQQKINKLLNGGFNIREATLKTSTGKGGGKVVLGWR